TSGKRCTTTFPVRCCGERWPRSGSATTATRSTRLRSSSRSSRARAASGHCTAWPACRSRRRCECTSTHPRTTASRCGGTKPCGSLHTTPRTMTALSTDGVALDGSLFSQRALSTGLRLQGWLCGAAVRSLHLGGSPITELLLGSRRSLRGRATVEFDTEAVPEPVENEGNDVVLRLASPGVFVDDYGLPSAKPSSAELSEVLGVQVLDIREWVRWEEAGGWHAASGLPKPVEQTVAAGSTYRVRCAEKPSDEALRHLMARGVGLRRREGYGALYAPTSPLGFAAFTGK